MKMTEISMDESQLSDDTPVTVTTAGNVVNIKSVSKKNRHVNMLKLSNDEYLVVSTGEIKTIEHTDNRSQNINSLLKTLAKLRDLINANVSDPDKLLWATLTYADNMTDSKQLYDDCHNFYKKLKRYFSSEGMETPEYIAVAEPQERGAWHIHLLLIWERHAPFFPNCKLRKIWGHGFVSIKKVDESCDNIGAYLTPYLTDLVLSDTDAKKFDLSDDRVKEIQVTEDGKKVTKKVIKGARLYLYPPGMNLFRHSRGIKKPTSEKMTYKQAKEKVSGATKTFEKSVMLEEESFKSIIYNAYYNTKR